MAKAEQSHACMKRGLYVVISLSEQNMATVVAMIRSNGRRYLVDIIFTINNGYKRYLGQSKERLANRDCPKRFSG